MLGLQHGDLAKHYFGFGVSVSVVSSHDATAARSVGLVSFSFVSTSLVCRRLTNRDKSLPENVSVLPVVLISCCDSWI